MGTLLKNSGCLAELRGSILRLEAQYSREDASQRLRNQKLNSSTMGRLTQHSSRERVRLAQRRSRRLGLHHNLHREVMLDCWRGRRKQGGLPRANFVYKTIIEKIGAYEFSGIADE